MALWTSAVAPDYTPQLRYAHGSTLAILPNGLLAAAFQARITRFAGL